VDRRLFKEEHERYRTAFRTFVEREVVPHRDEWAERGVVSREAWAAAARGGFVCPNLRREYGGGGLDFLHSVVICEELARVHESGFGLNLHSDIAVPYIEKLGSDAQKQRYLPRCATAECITAVAITEPGGGSDPAAIETMAEPDPATGGWSITGRKVFIANGELCDVMIVVARTARDVNPQRALSLFLVDADAPGFQRGRKLRKIGMSSQDTMELVFDGCRVGPSALLGHQGAALLYLLQKLQQERLIVAVNAQARAEQLLAETIAYVKERKIQGKPLGSYQNTAFVLADCAAKVEVGRAFIDRLCEEHVAGEYLVDECAKAKLWTTEMLGSVSDACLQLWGAPGCLTESVIGRGFVDARLQRIYAGTSEIMKVIIASHLGLGERGG